MSSGRSRGRSNSHNKGRQAAQSNPAQPVQQRTSPRQPTPPVPPPSNGGSMLVLWGGLILAVLVAAFLAILFLPSIFGPNPGPTPTPTVLPVGSATAVGPTSITTPGDPAQPQGRIAFVRPDSKGLRSLYVVNADGTNQQRVTDSIIVEGTIVWTPDGTGIVMQAGVEGVSRVVRVGIGPDNKMADSAQLTADVVGDSAFPALSPDGKLIAYQFKPAGGQFQIYVMNTDGSGKHMVSDGNGVASLPTWSPDSKAVAYVQGAEQTSGSVKEIWTVDVDGGTPKKITNTGVALTYPSWSPDGKSIVSAEIVGERDYKLLIMDASGANTRTLDEGRIIRWPVFSPQGDAILYFTITSGVGNDVNIYDLKADRYSSPTKNQGDNYNPAWSPDGTKIAWSSQPGGSSVHKIVVANRDGSNRRIVTSGDGDDTQPVWGRAVEK